MTRGLIIDMDGVIYRGETLIPGAQEFVAKLVHDRIPFVFVTNNSAHTPEQYVTKLLRLGIHVEPHQIITSGEVAAEHIAVNWPNGRVFLIGEDCIREMLEKRGITAVQDEQPDCVLIAEVRSLCYSDLCLAAKFVLGGANFLATNMDSIIPTVGDPILGCGAIASAIERAAGKKAVYLGKPVPHIAQLAAQRLGIAAANLIVVGDNLETDMGLAKNLGIPSILVLSGLTKRADLAACAYKPSKVVDSVAELVAEGSFSELTLIA